MVDGKPSAGMPRVVRVTINSPWSVLPNELMKVEIQKIKGSAFWVRQVRWVPHAALRWFLLGASGFGRLHIKYLKKEPCYTYN